MPNKSLSRSGLLTYQKYSSLLAGNDPYLPPDEALLAETLLTSAQSSVTFSSLDVLAADYKNLYIRMLARSNRAADASSFEMRFNGDTASNYRDHHLRSDGSTFASYDSGSRGFIGAGLVPAANFTAGVYGAVMMEILDAFETTKFKVTKNHWFVPSGTFKFLALTSGSWRSTSPITSITIYDPNASFIAGSSFSLIGVK